MTQANKVRIIFMLDREFDKTVTSIENKKALMRRTNDLRTIGKLASEAAEQEEYLEVLFNMALKAMES
jgi:hypothetical protein